MFKDINGFESGNNFSYSLAGNIMIWIAHMHTNDQCYIYKIMDYMLKLNMDTTTICIHKTTMSEKKAWNI